MPPTTSPDERFIKGGRLNRTIPAALEDLRGLLEGDISRNRDRITTVVAELEAYGDAIISNPIDAPQHEVDSVATEVAIRNALSDQRLRTIGITSRLANPEKQPS